MHDDAVIRLDPQYAPIDHRDNQHPTVRKPAETGDGSGKRCDDLVPALRPEPNDTIGVNVGYVQGIIVPTWRLAERDAGYDFGNNPCHHSLR
ncbi:hypothetical protein GCM10009087_12910 [Sphingomonas oligophenolica]